MYSKIDNILDPLDLRISVILKEAKEEDLLVSQLICVMLSAYTNNHLNMAVNSPSGEGKGYRYVIHNVAKKFPKVIFLAGMTDRALFQRSGTLVVRNERGEYDFVDDRIASIDSQIRDKESEMASINNTTLKKGVDTDEQEL